MAAIMVLTNGLPRGASPNSRGISCPVLNVIFQEKQTHTWACQEEGHQDGEGCENTLRVTVARSRMKRPDAWETD